MAKAGGKRPGAGRKAGVPNAVSRELREIARQYTDGAVLTLAGIMVDTNEPAAARVHSAETLLAYGHGKPRQQLEHTGKDGKELALAETDPSKVALAILSVLRAAREADPTE